MFLVFRMSSVWWFCGIFFEFRVFWGLVVLGWSVFRVKGLGVQGLGL